MSWDEEWAQLKADALARQQQSAHMQLNQLPADMGGSAAGPSGHGDGFAAKASSIDGSSHLLLEIAGVLYEGRMDGENATMCRAPRAHPDVASNAETFARFTQDQYNDAVVLLAALAGKLKSTNNTYAEYDDGVRGKLNSVLVSGHYTEPGDR
ncbi:hypothetical protein [Streptomyces sp. PanSC9]|uniref:hypothetical protein n=1 Tax=Streptomyces sp. PanSC9 TaxID=1520461 RepID=UPI000F499ADD|nr:hypothetical protein [Streptomyces sp. PanSC9]ROP48036.1 hypothetical protein EDD94_7773 [Streptomyces sp. PanSC9]